jgi:hypothetical protein
LHKKIVIFAKEKINGNFMEAIRKVVQADILATVIDLPWTNRNMKVEVIVLPVGEMTPTTCSSGEKSLKGILKKYADPTLLEKEQGVWSAQISEKYGAF